MSGTRLAGRITTLLLLGAGLTATTARADEAATGGPAAPVRPTIQQLTCADGQAGTCARGQDLRVAGDALTDARRVVFRGRLGHHDDRVAVPQTREDHELTVRVPVRARSGPIQVVGAGGHRSAPRPLLIRAPGVAATPPPVPAPGAAPSGEETFPIRGPHQFGQSAANRFGGASGHQGQDVFAPCGSTLVAARAGRVTKATFQSRAGNYVVVSDDTGQSYAYMHMRAAPLVAEGESATAGQAVGEVGQTGRASGCHLHFELWTAPGWYEGGKAIDPMPELQRLDPLG